MELQESQIVCGNCRYQHIGDHNTRWCSLYKMDTGQSVGTLQPRGYPAPWDNTQGCPSFEVEASKLIHKMPSVDEANEPYAINPTNFWDELLRMMNHD